MLFNILLFLSNIGEISYIRDDTKLMELFNMGLCSTVCVSFYCVAKTINLAQFR